MKQKTKFKRTELGFLPEEWMVDRLENHLMIKGRIGWKGLKVSEYTANGSFIVGGLQIKEVGVEWSECAHVTEERYSESPEIMLQQDDILMTKDGTIGKLAYIKELLNKTTVASHIHVIRRKSKQILPKFLFYFFKSPVFQALVESKISGSVVPALTQRDINSTFFPILPIAEQIVIANFLSNLDSRIELNEKMNKTLETIGQEFFKHWFVDFEFPDEEGKSYKSSGGEMFHSKELNKEIPKGWTLGCIGDIANNTRKGTKSETVAPDTPFIGLEHMPRNSMALTDWDYAESVGSNKYMFSKGDILFGKLRPYFHKVGITAIDGICSTDILIIVPKQQKWYGFVLYHISSDELIRYTNAASSGTRMPRTSWADIANYQILLPPEDIAERFTEIIYPFLQRIQFNILESHTLEKIRDSFLPKLMSGKIRVPISESVN